MRLLDEIMADIDHAHFNADFGRHEHIGLDGWYIAYPSDYVGPFFSRTIAAATALIMPGSPMKIIHAGCRNETNPRSNRRSPN